MKMNGILSIRVVHEAHHRLGTPRNDDGRARRNSIVANEPRGFEVRVDLLEEGFNVELVVPNLFAGDGVGDFSAGGEIRKIQNVITRHLLLWRCNRRNGKGCLVKFVRWTLITAFAKHSHRFIFNNTGQGRSFSSRNFASRILPNAVSS